MMGAYVEDQAAINARRMKEVEAQMQTVRDAELAAANAAINATVSSPIEPAPVPDTAGVPT